MMQAATKPEFVVDAGAVALIDGRERAARGEGINVYRMDTVSGNWAHVQNVADLVNPSFFAFDRR